MFNFCFAVGGDGVFFSLSCFVVYIHVYINTHICYVFQKFIDVEPICDDFVKSCDKDNLRRLHVVIPCYDMPYWCTILLCEHVNIQNCLYISVLVISHSMQNTICI